jgi:hypothetical protein
MAAMSSSDARAAAQCRPSLYPLVPVTLSR